MEKTISKERPLKKKPSSNAKITSRKTSIIVISMLTGCIFGSIVFFCISHIIRKNFLSEIEKKYEQDVGSLKRSIADKDHEIALLQSKSLKTSSTLKIEIDKLNVKIAEKVKEIEELKSQPLLANKNTIIEQEKELSNLKIENDILKTKYNDMLLDQQRIEKEYKEQYFLNEENSEYDPKNTKEDLNNTPGFGCTSIIQEMSSMELKDQSSENQKNVLFGDVTTENIKNNIYIEENNSVSSIKIDIPNEENGNLGNKAVDIKTEMNEAKSKENGLDSILFAIKALKQQNRKLRQDLKKAMESKPNYPLIENDSKTSEMNKVFDEYKNSINEMKVNETKLKERVNELDLKNIDLESQVNSLATKEQQLVTKNDFLENEKQDLQKQINELLKTSSNDKSINVKQKLTMNENARLILELGMQNEINKKLEEKVKKLEREVDGLNGVKIENEELKSEVQKLALRIKQTEETEAEVKGLNNQIAALEKSVVDQSTLVAKISQEKEILAIDLNELNKKVETLTLELSSKEALISNLSRDATEFKNAQQIISTLDQENISIKEELAKNVSEVKALTDKATKLEIDLAQKNEDIGKLKETLDVLSVLKNDQEVEILSLKQTLAENQQRNNIDQGNRLEIPKAKIGSSNDYLKQFTNKIVVSVNMDKLKLQNQKNSNHFFYTKIISEVNEYTGLFNSDSVSLSFEQPKSNVATRERFLRYKHEQVSSYFEYYGFTIEKLLQDQQLGTRVDIRGIMNYLVSVLSILKCHYIKFINRTVDEQFKSGLDRLNSEKLKTVQMDFEFRKETDELINTNCLSMIFEIINFLKIMLVDESSEVEFIFDKLRNLYFLDKNTETGFFNDNFNKLFKMFEENSKSIKELSFKLDKNLKSKKEDLVKSIVKGINIEAISVETNLISIEIIKIKNLIDSLQNDFDNSSLVLVTLESVYLSFVNKLIFFRIERKLVSFGNFKEFEKVKNDILDEDLQFLEALFTHMKSKSSEMTRSLDQFNYVIEYYLQMTTLYTFSSSDLNKKINQVLINRLQNKDDLEKKFADSLKGDILAEFKKRIGTIPKSIGKKTLLI